MSIITRMTRVKTDFCLEARVHLPTIRDEKETGDKGLSSSDVVVERALPGTKLQQFPGSGISRNDPGSGKWFPGSNSRSKKFYLEKRKKYILSAIEIYKNPLKVRNEHQTTYKIAVNRLSHSYNWKLVSDNMGYVWSKLISEGGIKRDGNSREVYTGIRESKRRELPTLYSQEGHEDGPESQDSACLVPSERINRDVHTNGHGWGSFPDPRLFCTVP